jgi:hypothetical protein
VSQAAEEKASRSGWRRGVLVVGCTDGEARCRGGGGGGRTSDQAVRAWIGRRTMATTAAPSGV